MKKLIKIIVVAVLMASSLVADSLPLEIHDIRISNENNLLIKQAFICEREAIYIFKNPMECIKAARISLNEYDSMPKNYTSYEEYRAGMYYNAGVIYGKIGDNANAVDMYKKALEFSPNFSSANATLGYAYAIGKGVKENRIKAYEHWRVAAKQGDQQAQNNLDILCNESPWACK